MAINFLRTWIIRGGLALIRPTWPQKRFLRKFLKTHNVDCVLDVGANVGQFATELRQIGYKGLIISFEPDPEVFAQMKVRLGRDLRWIGKNMALGAGTGTLTLNRMALSVFNSFMNPVGRNNEAFLELNQLIGTVEVQMERLDNIWPKLKADHRFERPFLKMDTQGFDLEVFKGSAGIRDELVGVQSEVALEKIYEESPDFATAMQAYRDAGFIVAGVFAVNPGLDRVYEVDCYFAPKPRQP